MSKSQQRKPVETLSPLKIVADLWGARVSLALAAAIELDIVTIIAEGKGTAAEIAKAINASQRGVERILDALVVMGYVTRRGTQHALTPIADSYLVRTKPGFLGAMAAETRLNLPAWLQLPDVVRSGKPLVMDPGEAREFYPKLVKAIFPFTHHAAKTLIQGLPQAKLKKIERVLDVAAGSAAWSIPFAQANASLRVTALDYPQVIPTTREYAQNFGVADQYDYIEGDLNETDFGQKMYDVVLLGHIIHGLGAKLGKQLIRKSYKALKPGGTLVIAEFIPNDARTGPLFPVLFGLNMIMHSNEGDVFTMAEYKEWLKQAEFTSIKLIEADAPSPVILATRCSP